MTYSKNSTNASLFSNLSTSTLAVPILNPSTISDFSSMFYEVIYDGSIYAAKEMLKKSLVTLMPLLLLRKNIAKIKDISNTRFCI